MPFKNPPTVQQSTWKAISVFTHSAQNPLEIIPTYNAIYYNQMHCVRQTITLAAREDCRLWDGMRKSKYSFIISFYKIMTKQRNRLFLCTVTLYYSSIPGIDNGYLFSPKRADRFWGPPGSLRISSSIFVRPPLNVFSIIVFKVKVGLNFLNPNG